MSGPSDSAATVSDGYSAVSLPDNSHRSSPPFSGLALAKGHVSEPQDLEDRVSLMLIAAWVLTSSPPDFCSA